MTSPFGSAQPIVLSSENRNWENVVLLSSRPTITPETNLIGQLASDKVRAGIYTSLPSGFINVGAAVQSSSISADLASAKSGDVLFTEQLSNSFYLAAKNDTNLAVVNGWLINVAGTKLLSEATQHNLIEVASPDSISSLISFVFLEAYQKVIAYDQPIKKYGNEDALSVTNDLLIPGIGVETSKRVQICYRIRVIDQYLDLGNYPDGFMPSIKAFGASASDTSYSFSSMASFGDAGLWRAGDGSEYAAEGLGTIDGYSYAIPMFAVSRRVSSDAYDPTTYEGMYNAGKLSDGNSFRPDALYADKVYAVDLVDLRHKVSVNDCDFKTLAAETLRGVSKGALSTRKGRVLNEGGSYSDAPGGSMLIKYDLLTSASDSSAGTRLGVLKSGVCRRVAANQAISQINTVTTIGVADWESVGGDIYNAYIDLSGYASATGAVLDVDSTTTYMYSTVRKYINYTTQFDPVSFILKVTANKTITTDVNLRYDISLTNTADFGFTDVPEKVLEQRYYSPSHGINTPHINAAHGNPISLFKRSSIYSLEDTVSCIGTEYKDVSSFGQVATINTAIDLNDDRILIPFGGETAPGTNQNILGVRSVQCKNSAGELSAYLNFDFDWTPTTGDLSIHNVTIPTGYTNNVLVSVYLGTKFFKTSREGKGIVETYESAFVPVSYISGTNYTITTDTLADTVSKKSLVGFCSKIVGSVTNPTSIPYVLWKPQLGGTDKYSMVVASSALVNTRTLLPHRSLATSTTPDSTTPTTVKWDQGNAIGSINDTIIAGVHVMSWLEATEKAYVTYNTRGYQGLMPTSPVNVTVISEGPALISASGSYAPIEKTFSLEAYNHEVTGNNTITITNTALTGTEVIPGDLYMRSSIPYAGYRVATVTVSGGNTIITVYDALLANGTFSDSYFVRRDTNQFLSSNLVDRLPTATEDSYLYGKMISSTERLKVGLTSVYGSPILSGVDPVISDKNGVVVGPPSLNNAVRGRFGMLVNAVDGFDQGTSLPVPALYYDKVTAGTPYKIFQSYIVKEEVSGKVYLAVLASSSPSGKENPSTNSVSLSDVVDLFEIKTRILTKS